MSQNIKGKKKRGKALSEFQRQVLAYLLPCMATDEELCEKIFMQKSANHRVAMGQTTKTIKEMKEGEYINSIFSSKGELLVAAKKGGIEEVLGDYPYFTLETAWDHFPKRDQSDHDLMYGGAIRKILNDFDRPDILYVKPEHYLKQVAGERGLFDKKGKYYPDCELAFFLHGKQSLDIEIVCGGVEKQALLGKIVSSNLHFLCIVREGQQIEKLLDDVMDFRRNWHITEHRTRMVHFVSKHDFFSQKFQDVLWHTPLENSRMTIKDFLGASMTIKAEELPSYLRADDDGDFFGPL